jgi:hypothetical protein
MPALIIGFVRMKGIGKIGFGPQGANSDPWTLEHVETWLSAFQGSGPIAVLANREPIRHDYAPDGQHRGAAVGQRARDSVGAAR